MEGKGARDDPGQRTFAAQAAFFAAKLNRLLFLRGVPEEIAS